MPKEQHSADYLEMTSITRFAAIWLLLGGISVSFGQEVKSLDPAVDKARLLKVESNFALWYVRELVPGTEQRRAQGFVHRFYRQDLHEPKGALIYEYRDTAVGFQTAIREDGALLLVTRRRLHFVPAKGEPQKTELPWLHCLAAFPDGLLALDTEVKDPRQYYPVVFVPFDGDQIHLDMRVQVVPPGVRKFTTEQGLGYPGDPFRLADVFAWGAQGEMHTFHSSSGKRKSIELARNAERITAYDGATVVFGIFAFDAATGEVLGEPDYPKRPRNVLQVFVVRNRIGYYFDSGTLRATDLTSADGVSVRIADADAALTHQDEHGLRFWDGTKWAEVAWLTEFPASPKGTK